MSVRSIDTAPSSPGRTSSCSNLGEDFYFSEPTSPTHFLTLHLLQTSVSHCDSGNNLSRAEEYRKEYLSAVEDPKISQGINAVLNGGGDHVTSFEFEFSSRHSEMAGDQPFAEELFLNGQIRPLNPDTKSEYIVSSGSVNAPPDEDGASKSYGHKEYSTKMSKGRSASLRNFLWEKCVNEDIIHQGMKDDTDKMKFESERDQDPCSRGSKRWRLKDFLGRSSGSDRKRGKDIPPAKQAQKHIVKKADLFDNQSNNSALKATESRGEVNKFSKSKGIYSTHELQYKAKRGEADESRRKSFLPYTRGILGGLMNGLARNLHPFSSI